MKLTRGQKQCKHCGAVNAARQRVCTKCSISFDCKNVPVKSEVTAWKDLKCGEYIKTVLGTGPYYMVSKNTETSKAGEKICMGDGGIYMVHRVDEKGIHVYGATSKNGGYSYLYMGEPYHSEITGMIYEKYRIKKVKRRV